MRRPPSGGHSELRFGGQGYGIAGVKRAPDRATAIHKLFTIYPLTNGSRYVIIDTERKNEVNIYVSSNYYFGLAFG